MRSPVGCVTGVFVLAGPAGIEPALGCLTGTCLTAWLQANISQIRPSAGFRLRVYRTGRPCHLSHLSYRKVIALRTYHAVSQPHSLRYQTLGKRSGIEPDLLGVNDEI